MATATGFQGCLCNFLRFIVDLKYSWVYFRGVSRCELQSNFLKEKDFPMKKLAFCLTLTALSLGLSSIAMAGLPHPIGGTDKQARCITALNSCIALAYNCATCTPDDADNLVESCITEYNNCMRW